VAQVVPVAQVTKKPVHEGMKVEANLLLGLQAFAQVQPPGSALRQQRGVSLPVQWSPEEVLGGPARGRSQGLGGQTREEGMVGQAGRSIRCNSKLTAEPNVGPRQVLPQEQSRPQMGKPGRTNRSIAEEKGLGGLTRLWMFAGLWGLGLPECFAEDRLRGHLQRLGRPSRTGRRKRLESGPGFQLQTD